MNAQEILKKYWGFDQFRSIQKEVIDAVLAGKDTLALMPTGGGKSACFQIPALMHEGLCIVVSPLIALMKDQVANLKKKGILSLAVHSGQRFREVKQQFENAVNGDYKFLYVSPERLETSLFLEYLPYLKVNLIAVDEAHCISQWGYDFRPAYLRIAALRQHLLNTPMLALTASATRKVQRDICTQLNFKQGFEVFAGGFTRKNLSYSVFMPPAREVKIKEIFSKVLGPGIAYCRTRKRSRELAQMLNLQQLQSDFYHAGLSNEERTQRQEEWTANRTRIICCTNAFGMGIDKPDVRAVVHYDLPDALEYYYQQAGRAGRDGKRAYAVLLFNPSEISDYQKSVALRFPDTEKIREVYAALCNYLQLPAGKGKGLALEFDIARFIDNYKLNPLLTGSVLKILEQEEIIFSNDDLLLKSSVEFLTSRDSLEAFENDFPQYNEVIKGLLRSYEGIFEQPVFIDEFELAKFIHRKKDQITAQLNELNNLKIIEYIPSGDLPGIVFLADRVPAADLVINQVHIRQRKEAYLERLQAMAEYATQREECRSIFINRYFGGAPCPPCGICDVCLSKKEKPVTPDDIDRIMKLLGSDQSFSWEDIKSGSGLSINKVSEILYFLSREGRIAVKDDGRIVGKN